MGIKCMFCADRGEVFADKIVNGILYEDFYFRCFCEAGKKLQIKVKMKYPDGSCGEKFEPSPFPTFTRDMTKQGYRPKRLGVYDLWPLDEEFKEEVSKRVFDPYHKFRKQKLPFEKGVLDDELPAHEHYRESGT